MDRFRIDGVGEVEGAQKETHPIYDRLRRTRELQPTQELEPFRDRRTKESTTVQAQTECADGLEAENIKV